MGYEGRYQVSNIGRIKSLGRMVYSGHNYQSARYQPTRILQIMTHVRDSYELINLYDSKSNPKNRTAKVHRLVGDAFIPNPKNYPEINHKDGIRDNNVVENLEWCTREYNMAYNNGHKRMAKARCKPVIQYSLDGEHIKTYPSVYSTKQDGFTPQGVGMCCMGNYKTHKGYIWRYASD